MEGIHQILTALEAGTALPESCMSRCCENFAVFVTALTLRGAHRNHDFQRDMHDITEQVERIAMMVLLLAFGGALVGGLLGRIGWLEVLAAVLILFVVRPATGLLGMVGARYTYFVDRQSPDFKAPWNQLYNTARVFTPEDRAIVSPNSDTPYSMLGMDLRTEPLILTVPPIEKDRYFSIQLIDLYTFNFDYIGSRTTGNDGGSFLIAGPNWKGEVPKGVKKVIHSETELALAVYRTQLLNPDDIENVKKVQSGYKVQPLSEFLGQAAPKTAPTIDFMKPLTPEDQKTSPEFFSVLNFILQFSPTVPSETELMARFAKIGVGAGETFDLNKLSPELKAAIEQGMADAWAEFSDYTTTRIDTGQVTSGDFFGTRDYLKNNYLNRMAGGVIGLYGNSKQEAMYPFYGVDSDNQALSGANRYTVHFAPGKLPPANAFWSLTMYELPDRFLSANSINRYLINSPMLPQLQRDADGGLTLLIQNESPGKEKEANWLPAPKGPFFMAMRIYWPKQEALDGKWTAPLAIRSQ